MNLCVKACLFAVVTACSVIPPTCARPIVRDTDIDVRLRTGGLALFLAIFDAKLMILQTRRSMIRLRPRILSPVTCMFHCAIVDQ